MGVEGQQAVSAKVCLKGVGKGALQLSTAGLAARYRLPVDYLTAVSGLGGKVMQKGSGVHG
jgi:hypothetical protein